MPKKPTAAALAKAVAAKRARAQVLKVKHPPTVPVTQRGGGHISIAQKLLGARR